MPDSVRVGRLRVPLATAAKVVRDYVEHTNGLTAWPFYDLLDTAARPNHLSDGDLLAPLLLNAGLSIRGFAGVAAQRERLETLLERLPSDLSLADASDADLDDLAALFAVLDNPGIAHVGGTRLSKVLHRKRPQLIPLFDSRLLSVYVGEFPAPIEGATKTGRTWEQFMRRFSGAVRDDLSRAKSDWHQLARVVPDGSLTPLRALDMVGWTLGVAE